ncbi:MAG TPA: SchA/CurD-like domain-containing protein [Nocardioides sp.]
MPYAALTFRVKPGHDDEIAEIFARQQRVDSSGLRDDGGEESGRLLGTAVFIKDGLIVRIIHYEGDLADVARKMADQGNVQCLERSLAPYLTQDRDTSTAAGFAEHFRSATMRCVTQLGM